MADDLVARAVFRPHPRSAVDARRFVADTLRAWGEDLLLDRAVMLANELATNAILHARTDFEVTVRVREDALRIEVRDGDSAPPVLVPWSEVETAGRGLHVVESASKAWGSIPEVGAGKVVWAELSRSGPSARRAG